MQDGRIDISIIEGPAFLLIAAIEAPIVAWNKSKKKGCL
jgi:hypothetical protein